MLPAIVVVALIILLLTGPFVVLVNSMPFQRLLLWQAGTIGVATARFPAETAMHRVRDLLLYLALRHPLPGDGFYSPLEITHLADVQSIFQLLYLACGLSLLLLLLALPFLRRARKVTGTVRSACLATLALLLLLSSTALTTGFDAFFITFHELAFRNDFWLLPEGSRLIQLFPESYFMNCFFICLGGSAIASCCLLLLSYRRHPPQLFS